MKMKICIARHENGQSHFHVIVDLGFDSDHSEAGNETETSIATDVLSLIMYPQNVSQNE